MLKKVKYNLRKNETYYVYDCKDSNFEKKALKQIRSEGFVVLRNLISEDHLNKIIKPVDQILSKPNIGGNLGYYRKDIFKKMYDALLLGRPVIDLFLNKKMLIFLKKYFNNEFYLAEANLKYDEGLDHVYFPMHSDFDKNWAMPLASRSSNLGAEDFKKIIGCGIMVYLEDTTDGAFCYSPGSHKFHDLNNSSVENWNEVSRNKVYQNILRIEGKKGDIVLFNDLGAHGPEQPVKVHRKVLLGDYYNKDVFGFEAKTAIPVYLSDLSNLNNEQLEILGAGAKAMSYAEDYHTRHFNRMKCSKMVFRTFTSLVYLEKLRFKFFNFLRRIKSSKLS